MMQKSNNKLMSASVGRMTDLSKTSVQKIQDKSATLRNDLRHTNPSRQTLGSSGAFGLTRSSVEDEHLQKQIEQLRGDLKRRQETYVRRERAYTVRIEELEQELAEIRAGKTKWMKDDRHMATLKKLHYEILKNVDQVQERTAKILQEQERDLNRSFKARLFDVQTELEKEKGKKDDGAAAYIEKSKQLEDEVDRMKEMADRLDRVNASLMRENARLKSQFQTQEEDRDFLIKQLVQVKRENKRLNQQIEELEKNQTNTATNLSDDEDGRLGSPQPATGLRGLLSSRDALSSPMLARPNSSGMDSSVGARPDTAYQRSNDAAHNRLKDINKKLRKLLDRDRKNLEMVRKQLTNELKQRTELETMLRQCVDDVKQEIKKRRRPSSHMSSRPSTRSGERPGTADQVGVDDFTQQDREAALELLLSQERVIQLLYSRTFPPRNQEGESAEFAALATSESEKFEINAGLPSSTAKSTDSFYRLPSKDTLRKTKSKGSPLHDYMPAINS